MLGGAPGTKVAILDSFAEDEGSWEVDEADVESELSMLLRTGDVAKTSGVVVELFETAAIALAGPDGDDGVGNVTKVEAVITSEVVKARLLVESSEVALCEAKTEALADSLLGKTRAVTVLGP